MPEVQNTGWNAYSQEDIKSVKLFSLKCRLNNNTTKKKDRMWDEGHKQKTKTKKQSTVSGLSSHLSTSVD